MKKVVVGMSGGVDSSVAAFLLKESGYDVKGVTMQTWEDNEPHGMAILRDAKRVAEVLGISHEVIDFKDEFKKEVVDYFVGEYLCGRTPNPCTVCNRFVKWQALLKYCENVGADYVGTGHYAHVCRIDSRYTLRKSTKSSKDQTYALYNLSQEQLAKTLMPIGEYTKEEVRQIAKRENIPVADKPDSQEICFIPDDDYAGFISRRIESNNKEISGKKKSENDADDKSILKPGNFVTKTGEILGVHKGITHYTIGQRRGLGLAMGHHVFVTEIRPDTNEVVVGESEELFSTELRCNKINFMGMADLIEPRKVIAKVRYAHQGQEAVIEKISADEIRCTFLTPVRAITPGQAVVFYEGDYVLGGGTIL